MPLPGSNNESWCQGLDGLASRTAAYYQQGARFAKWYEKSDSLTFIIHILNQIFELVSDRIVHNTMD